MENLKTEVIKLAQINFDGTNKRTWITFGTTEDRYESIIASLYLMYLIKTYSEVSNFEELVKAADMTEDRRMFITHQIDVEKSWDEINEVCSDMDPESLKKAILTYSDVDSYVYGLESSTPDCINELAAGLLDINANDRVADICCGLGTFLTYVDANYTVRSLYGNEINTTKKEIIKIRSELYKAETTIELGNALNLDYETIKANKIFSNYPWGIRTSMYDEDSKFGKLIDEIPEFKKKTVSDWIFNYYLINCMTEDGKAVAVMTNGSTWDNASRDIRKLFLKNGYIEAIISLPKNLFPSTGVSTSMIVLSRNNKDVMLVNAENLFEQGRRKNTITGSDIQRIILAAREDSDISRRVTLEEFEDGDWGINPTRYLTENVELENAIPFGDIIKEVRRGAQISGADLDANSSQDQTNIQYLMLSNIKNGLIDDDLPYLKSLDKKYDKFCLHTNDMIISKIGTPTKIAIAEVKGKTKIVANGNLYIVSIDESKANPFYVKAFLESEIGASLLCAQMVGSVMPSISLDRLKSVMIPMLPIEEQNRLGTMYQAKIDSLFMQKKRIQKTIEEINHMYDSWKDGE